MKDLKVGDIVRLTTEFCSGKFPFEKRYLQQRMIVKSLYYYPGDDCYSNEEYTAFLQYMGDSQLLQYIGNSQFTEYDTWYLELCPFISWK